METVAVATEGGRVSHHLDHLVAQGHDRSELEWETVELVLGGIGEVAQAAWHQANPEPMTEWERRAEMRIRQWEELRG